MADPDFTSPDSLASMVLIGELMEELVAAGVLTDIAKERLLRSALGHLDLVGTRQSALAANLIIQALGPEDARLRDPAARPLP